MKFARLLPVFVFLAVSLAACSKDDSDSGTGQANAVGGTGSHSLLELVPADTPYLGGNLAPIPDELVDSYLQRVEPILAIMQQEMSTLKVRIESDPDELQSDAGARVILAMIEELDGKLNRAGLESLGIDVTPEQVVYGMSAFPVMRTSLADATALRATVQRILDKAEVPATSLELQGQEYWRVVPDMHEYDDSGAVIDNPNAEKEAIGLYIAILDDHLAFGILPVFAESSVLPAFLALEKPSDSNAAATLKALNQKNGYSPYGSGVMEFQKLFDELANADSLVGQYFSQAGHDLTKLNSDACRQEFTTIIARNPRASTGFSELTETVISSRMVLETESSLAGELMALVADVPAANPASKFLAELSLGLKVGPLRDFLRTRANNVVAEPFQCASLAGLNEGARDAADQLNQPIPPMVNNLFGLRAAISSLGDASDPTSAMGLIALHVTQPEMLVGMAQMLVPNLAELDLTVGAPPVRVPADMLPLPAMVLYAAQAKTAIGLSVGEGQQAALPGFINQEGKADGTFLSVNYDSVAYMNMTDSMGGADLDDDPAQSNYDYADKLQAELKKLLDRSDTRLSFTKDGFVVDSTSTLKQP